jgi:hypothetical protein
MDTTNKINEPVCTITVIGNKEWRLDGQLHRVSAPAIEYIDGSKRWYLNDELHRTDGPAVEYANGDKCWYLNGKPHREDGPAIEYEGGIKYWFYHGKKLDCRTQEEFERLMQLRIFW